MPKPSIRYEVLIASPGDVQDERDVVDEVIRDWNSSHKATGIFLQSLRWELDAVPELGDRAQGIINKQLVDNADFVIALFSTRLGTPTGAAVSGTVEEIERLRAMGKHVMVYFSSAPLPRDHDPAQLKLLNEYRQELTPQGLCFEFKDKGDLRRLLSHNLATKMSSMPEQGTFPKTESDFASKSHSVPKIEVQGITLGKMQVGHPFTATVFFKNNSGRLLRIKNIAYTQTRPLPRNSFEELENENAMWSAVTNTIHFHGRDADVPTMGGGEFNQIIESNPVGSPELLSIARDDHAIYFAMLTLDRETEEHLVELCFFVGSKGIVHFCRTHNLP